MSLEAFGDLVTGLVRDEIEANKMNTEEKV